MTIINIRGTSGSGKSTLVRSLIQAFRGQPIIGARGKIQGYVLDNGTRVVGSYENPCGGCDAVPTQDEVCDLVQRFAAEGNVVFEGLLVSGLFSRYNSLADQLALRGHHTIFGFLSTPIEECISRVQERRMRRGNSKPFSPVNTIAKFHAVVSTSAKLSAAGKDVRTLPHDRSALEMLTEWLGHQRGGTIQETGNAGQRKGL